MLRPESALSIKRKDSRRISGISFHLFCAACAAHYQRKNIEMLASLLLAHVSVSTVRSPKYLFYDCKQNISLHAVNMLRYAKIISSRVKFNRVKCIKAGHGQTIPINHFAVIGFNGISKAREKFNLKTIAQQ